MLCIWPFPRTLPRIRTLTMKPMKMARPPRRGMGTLCIRRASLGTSTAPTLKAKVFTTGVMRKLMTSAASRARAA